MHRPIYRILFSLDGIRWIDDPRNNKWDVGQAVSQAKEFVHRSPNHKVRVINVRTRYVVWQPLK
jgi:hypothetical protein